MTLDPKLFEQYYRQQSSHISLFPCSIRAKNGSIGITGPGRLPVLRICLLFLSSSILNRRIWAAKLYSKGDGLSPWACPFSSSKDSDISPGLVIMQAFRPVPMDFNRFFILSLKTKKSYTLSMNSCETLSKAFAWSIVTKIPLILFFYRNP